MADRPTVVVAGAATRDVDARDPRGWRLGGTVTYAALAAARLDVSVRALIGVDRNSATAGELEVLRTAGVDLRTVLLERGPIFDNRQTPTGRFQHALAASDALSATELPADWHAPDAAILGPVAGELGDDWSRAFASSTFVGLAAQGLCRRLIPGSPVERIPLARGALVERADAILISAEDVVGADVSLDAVLRGDQQLVVTHGDRGALFLQRTSDRVIGRYLPPTPRRAALDTTGAGDIFLAAWVAARAMLARRPARVDEWRALLVASATASLSVERTSLSGLPTKRDICEVLVRLRDRRSSR